MAKVSGIFPMSGSINGLTFVDSRAYGRHVRRKRGTVTPVTVNDAFHKAIDELREATPYAKLIKDSVNPYLVNFRDGTLWSRLRSLFRSQVRAGTIDFTALQDFEFYKGQYFSTRMGSRLNLEASVTGSTLAVSIGLSSPPHFAVRYVDGYRLTLVVIAISANGRKCRVMDHVFPVVQLKDEAFPHTELTFPYKQAKWFVIAMKCEGYRDNSMSGSVRAKGMAVVEVKSVDSLQ